MTEQSMGAPVGMTDHELAALIDMEPETTPQAQKALVAMGIAGLLKSKTALRAGYSTLLVRGHAGLDGQGIIAQGVGAAIATMLSTADDILRLVITKDVRSIARTLLVEAEAGAFLLDMTSLGVHAAQPLNRETALPDLVANIVEEFALELQEDLPLDVEIARFPAEGEVRTAAFVIETPDAWRWPNTPAAPPASVWAKVSDALGESDGELGRTPRRAF